MSLVLVVYSYLDLQLGFLIFIEGAADLETVASTDLSANSLPTWRAER